MAEVPRADPNEPDYRLREPDTLFASDPMYSRINELMHIIAALKNPETHFDIAFKNQHVVPNKNPDGTPLLNKELAKAEYHRALQDFLATYIEELRQELVALENRNLSYDQSYVDKVFAELTADIAFDNPQSRARLNWEGTNKNKGANEDY